MRYSFFSDLHIKKPNDDACKLVEKLFQNETFKQSNHVYFLGDIFDAVIGEHHGHFEKYQFFFNHIVEILDRGTKVTYLEGNHDFHLNKTFNKYIRKHSKNFHLFEYRTEGEMIKVEDKNFYVCHGDEVDYYNKYFKRWKNVYTSKSFELFVNTLPYKFIDYLGSRASNNSKKRGKKSFNYEFAKEKYIKGAKALIDERKIDGVICGHTHIQENNRYSDSTVYLNCGFPLKDKNFLTISTEAEFILL